MNAGLQSLCLACAKHPAGLTGKLLAAVCLAPYLAVYHAAVVVHARREVHMLFIFLGLLLNTGLGFGIKNALRHPRPFATCEALGICHKHGMPSSHMQMMAFVATTCLLLHWQRQSQRPAGQQHHKLSVLVQQLQLLLLVSLAAAVGYARVELGYHTGDQVLAGAAVGSGFALLWHLLTMRVARPYFGQIAELSARLGLWFRDTLPYDDVYKAEFDACSSATMAGKKVA